MSIPDSASPNTSPPGDQSGPSDLSQSRFQTIWEDAVREYQRITGKDLLQHPLYAKLEHVKSVEDVVPILKDHEKGFQAFRKHGESIRAALAPIITITELFVDTAGEISVASGVSPGGKAIFTACGVFLRAAKDVSQRYDILTMVLQRLKSVLERLNGYLRSRSDLSIGLKTVFTESLAQLLKVLAMCTKYVNETAKPRLSDRIPCLKRMKDYGLALMGSQDVKDALAKLDNLVQEEHLIAVAQTLCAVQDMASDVRNIAQNVKEAGSSAQQVDKDVHDWLNPPDPSLLHEERQKLLLDGTCTWFFDDEKFVKWKESKNGVYWIYGNLRLFSRNGKECT
ncbi:hypothetical protein K488DRAFT_71826 [Vararia minispora EC-137]|uniref:Uncharacterized protein n=1 Tax=Vararia minispora EC-137 TaxID=1314806 RepID=A0ACB8QGY4_9AGAM|nr:hypothetical protein K488DRAFT_71826 [Vararia minispora EC-137]